MTTCALLCSLPLIGHAHAASSQGTAHNGPAILKGKEPRIILAQKTAARQERYQWLFNRDGESKQTEEQSSPKVLSDLDREILQAGRLYRSGKTEEGVRKYLAAIDMLESAIDYTPPGHPALKDIEAHFRVFDEMAARVMGPVYLEPGKDVSELIFRLMEKRRVLTRNLLLKRMDYHHFFDVDNAVLQREAELLRKFMDLRAQPATRANRRQKEELASKLESLRQSLFKSSPRYAVLRKGLAPSLTQVRRELLRDDEMILDYNLLQDRMIVGVITREGARWHQVGEDRFKIRSGIGRLIFNLQDRLQQYTLGTKKTFLGHAWKEPCRRAYRALFGKLPELPHGKKTIFIIPDGPLWYLPFHALLDPEDRPLGQNHLISLIPSVEMLSYSRSVSTSGKADVSPSLLLMESLPHVPEEELQSGARAAGAARKEDRRLSEHERIVRLILTNSVYDRPSQVTVSLRKLFKKQVGEVSSLATFRRLRSHVRNGYEVTLLAVPFSVSDKVGREEGCAWFFSPDRKGRRVVFARTLFNMPLKTSLLTLPISWFNATDKSSSLGEGPAILSTALLYTGVRKCLMNYSNPNWGVEEPYLMSVLGKISQGESPGAVLMEYPRKIPLDHEASFSGRPPAWTGWILMGDPK